MIKKFFAGNSGRSQFAQLWIGALFSIKAFSAYAEVSKSPLVALISLLVLVLGMVVMGVAVVRRARDLGHSPWFALLILIPFAGLYFLFAPGLKTPTQYELANPQETHQ